jgi:hypothetical protein
MLSSVKKRSIFGCHFQKNCYIIVKIQMNSGLLHLGGGEELVKGITVCYDLLPREVWE